MLKRIFDIFLSTLAIIILCPLMLALGLWILFDSKGGIFYCQQRVGKKNKDFTIFKFRSMKPASSEKGLLTIGMNDARITKSGIWLRKYKLDELPQLFNILIGDMSFVGPRPEVRKYVDFYNEEQKAVLSIRPGLTDYASLEYIRENELLAASENPEETYIKEIMPRKLQLNLDYMRNKGLITDIKILGKTIGKIISF